MLRVLLVATLLVGFSLGCEVDRTIDDAAEQDDGGEVGARCRTALDCDEGLRCRMESPTVGACFRPSSEDLEQRSMKYGPEGQPPPPYFARGVQR
jgi:hypothetical protein